jgi:hypothetical protein
MKAAPGRWTSSDRTFPIAQTRKAGRPKCGTDWDKSVTSLQVRLGAMVTAHEHVSEATRRSPRIAAQAAAQVAHEGQAMEPISLDSREVALKHNGSVMCRMQRPT